MAAPRILIMPAGPFQVPAIAKARDRGLRVVAMDVDPKAPGLAMADIPIVENPTDVALTIDAARHHKVSAVLSVASDPCVVPCAAVADALGLPGLKLAAAKRTRNKIATLDALRNAVPECCPRSCILENAGDLASAQKTLGFPIVLKPSEGHGSKGVIVVENEAGLVDAHQYARGFASGMPVLAQERLVGAEVSVESITVHGDTKIVAITDKRTSAPPYCAEIGHTVPSKLPKTALEALSRSTERIIAALDIDDSPSHTEMYLTDEGPKLVEIGARLGGGCIASHLVPLATGVDLIEAAICLALGEEPVVSPTRDHAASIQFLTPDPGVVSGVSGIEQARGVEGVEEVFCSLQLGDTIEPLANSDQRMGYVIARGQSSSEAQQAAYAGVCAIRVDYTA